MKQISIGKARGLQQLSNSKGIFTICSFDHRRSLRRMMNPDNPTSVTFQAMVDFKLNLCEALAPYASGVLLDPIYSASQCVAARVIPGTTGFMISLETAGYDSYGSDGQRAELLTHCDVEKAKFMGAAAVKIPLYYRPDLPNVAPEQLHGVTKATYNCQKIDLALFLGPHSYAVIELERNTWEFSKKKPGLVISTAQQLSALPIDVLKVEFPVDANYEWEPERLFDFCRQLSEASFVPWVLLSGGVNFDVFCQQLEIACKAGASGFLAGRALWQEAATMSTRKRIAFLDTMAVDRLRQLTDIANSYGKPWYQKLETCNDYLTPDFDESLWQYSDTPEMPHADQEGSAWDRHSTS